MKEKQKTKKASQADQASEQGQQPEGKKRMSAASFLNGYAVKEGTFFKRG